MSQQTPEVLFTENYRLSMTELPLKGYRTRIKRINEDDLYAPINSALHRGYVGIWELMDDHLMLVEIHRLGDTKKSLTEVDGKRVLTTKWGDPHYIIKSLFPESDGPVVATWYSATLELPIGTVEEKYDASMAPFRYRKYLVLEIENGKVVSKGIRSSVSELLESSDDSIDEIIALHGAKVSARNKDLSGYVIPTDWPSSPRSRYSKVAGRQIG